jgi:hypothetical protein
MTDLSHPRHPMTPPSRNASDAARSKAKEFFKEKQKRGEAVFEQMQTERTISDAKTAKLRALRLAKEEADRDAAGQTDAAVVKTKAPIVFNIK